MFSSQQAVELGVVDLFSHGTKNWIYCTFDARQRLSQTWYRLCSPLTFGKSGFSSRVFEKWCLGLYLGGQWYSKIG